jgi:hypothetical protein
MRRRSLVALAVSAAALSVLPRLDAMAGTMGPHPIRGWGGNRFLFVLEPDGDRIRLTAYRDVGSKWGRFGTTTISHGQKVAEQGIVQKIWFRGVHLGSIKADMNDPFWRAYPGDDRSGPTWP